MRMVEGWYGLVQIAKAYEEGGAACISVLTDSKYFQGDFSYLRDIRAAGVACPLLCKEFVVEAYQMFAARAAGADAILLIAAVLPNSDLAYLLKSAAKVNLQALVEVHTVSGEPSLLPGGSARGGDSWKRGGKVVARKRRCGQGREGG